MVNYCACFFTIKLAVKVSQTVACERQRKTNCAIIKSFPWFLFSPTIALHQSASEKLQSYCKKKMYVKAMLLLGISPRTEHSSEILHCLSCHATSPQSQFALVSPQ